MCARVGTMAAALAAGSSASAELVFSDDFEDGIGVWTGAGGGAHNGIIVFDPLETDDQVLTFSALDIAGDVFTLETFAAGSYVLEFDYLGLEAEFSVPGDLGGFGGISEDLPGTHEWLVGTSDISGAAPILIDDGEWRHYVVPFTTSFDSFHIMFEDFEHSGGVPGDAYFDNIMLFSGVPAPAGLLLLGLAGLVRTPRRRR